MRTAGPPAATVAILAPAIALAAVACSLTSLDGYAGPPPVELDANGPTPQVEAGADAPAPASSITSCDALKRAAPQTPDGPQLVDPDGPGPIAPFTAHCDMTTDEGGWMLIDAAHLGAETKTSATTVVVGKGDHDGAVLTVYVNTQGCASNTEKARHRIFVADRVPWQRVRLKQTFAGSASCWHVFGFLEGGGLDPNLVALDLAKDTVRNAKRMGGSGGDAFDGRGTRCDGDDRNFWLKTGPTREATVILRRRAEQLPAGLSTGADCSTYGPGVTSPTWWEYRDIYVK